MSRTWISLAIVLTAVAGTVCAQQPAVPAAASPAPAFAASSPAPAKPARVPRGPAAAESETLVVLKAGTSEHVRVICRLNGPAMNMANTINQLFRGEGQLLHSGGQGAKGATARTVVLVPDPVGNRLVIAGPPDAVREVQQLVEELDQPAGMVVLEMASGEAPAGHEKPSAGSGKSEGKRAAPAPAAQLRVVERPPQMETIGRVRVTTLDNQTAYIQIGSRVPGFHSAPAPPPPRQPGQPAGTGNSFVPLENVGLTLGVTPRIIPGAVVMEIDVTQSQVGPENESVAVGLAGKDVVRSAKIDTTMTQTTVRIRDGESMVLGSIARAGKPDKELLIIVTPRIVEPGGAAKTR